MDVAQAGRQTVAVTRAVSGSSRAEMTVLVRQHWTHLAGQSHATLQVQQEEAERLRQEDEERAFREVKEKE